MQVPRGRGNEVVPLRARHWVQFTRKTQQRTQTGFYSLVDTKSFPHPGVGPKALTPLKGGCLQGWVPRGVFKQHISEGFLDKGQLPSQQGIPPALQQTFLKSTARPRAAQGTNFFQQNSIIEFSLEEKDSFSLTEKLNLEIFALKARSWNSGVS